MKMNEKTPTVSVIIPTYNRAHLVGRAIRSVLNQTFQDFEIIVVDDGSTDNTEEVVKGFNDPRIRYIRHEENRGALLPATPAFVLLVENTLLFWIQTMSGYRRS
jgi:cellulose synthase/poly-beta-1,6-N-acetylglucosamine synthase-like glycosyltransferase